MIEDNNVYTICYNNLCIFSTKEEANLFYKVCFAASEGSEKERYFNILVDLIDSNIGIDDLDESYCFNIEVNPKLYDDSKDRVKYKLNGTMGYKAAINYYEQSIEPVIIVAKEYNINFASNMPFEDFGSDEENEYMYSFSEFYTKVLENRNITVNSVVTEEISDGKYVCTINDKIEIDIRANDTLNSIVENVDFVVNNFLLKTSEDYSK